MYSEHVRFISLFRRHRAAAAGVLVVAGVIIAGAQTLQPPYAMFQHAVLTGSGNTINATHIPVVTGTGTTVYKDLVLQFDPGPDGSLTLSAGYPQTTDSPLPTTSSFRPGKYLGPRTLLSGNSRIVIAGPAAGTGGTTQWSVSSPSDGNQFSYPGSATFYVGSIDSNPLAARIKRANITSTAFSYGFGGTAGVANWLPNALLGFSQIGNTLTIASFTSSGEIDRAIPYDQITYTLIE